MCRRILFDATQAILPSQGIVFVRSEGVVGENLHALQHAVGTEMGSQRADVGLAVAIPRYQHIAQPEGAIVRLQPGGCLQGVFVASLGDEAMLRGIELLDIQQHQVGQ